MLRTFNISGLSENLHVFLVRSDPTHEELREISSRLLKSKCGERDKDKDISINSSNQTLTNWLTKTKRKHFLQQKNKKNQPWSLFYAKVVDLEPKMEQHYVLMYYVIPCQSELQTKCINLFSNFPAGPRQ